MGKIIDEYNAVKEFRACVETIVDKYQMMQADYENRLKAEKIAMLEELNAKIEKTFKEEEPIDRRWAYGLHYSKNFIQQKIDELKGE